MPFFRGGLARGEKVFHVVETGHRDEHRSACTAAGIDVSGAETSGQLEVHSWDERPLRDGRFDGGRMVDFLEGILAEIHQRFARGLLMGEMEWLADRSDDQALLRYEARLNEITPAYPDVFICAYDINRHSGAVLMDILRTHPMVIVGGTLQENPLYVAPHEFLRELEARREPRNGDREA